ncbi:MAG: beta-propeller domain-containing protein [Parcubacteria group bacterium]|jgi:uncharacterized secreted protein with C-terminal beta-propeller domain
MEEKINQKNNPKFIFAVLASLAVIGILILAFLWTQRITRRAPVSEIEPVNNQKEKLTEVKKFASEQEFKDYLEKAKNVSVFSNGRGGGLMEMSAKSTDSINVPQATGLGAAPSRVSETNVQVEGIDEPDTVKTNGKEIFFSVDRPEIMPLDDTAGRTDESRELFPLSQTGGTKSIAAFPPENLKVDSKINRSGDLLLSDKYLIVIPSQRYFWSQDSSRIYGYDASNPENPREIWNMEIKKSSSIAGARFYKGKIYLAMKTDFSENESCLLEPLALQGVPFSIKCTDIYRPATVIPAEATYSTVIIDPASGKIEKSVSFVGSSDYTASTVYMSPEALYVTYYFPGDSVKILASFFSENGDLVPDWLAQKLKKLEGYDISSSAKMTEVWELIGRFQNSLSDDDRMRMQNEISNRMGDFLKNHRRDLDSTGIVKIGAGSLNIEATGNVPGKLLNQFSLDEYQGDLRVATTVGENFLGWGLGGARSSETVNDVYVLGDNMKTEGSVIDLGKGERIYSVRFIEDKGYVVTFKQVDPFYVIDLSDPMNPEKKGELKIPGYSSYLHPISKERILGIGEEDNRVKISLFDVSVPANPIEIAKYNLNEYYSEISQTHHAFLLDAKHKIFFLPGAKGGYVFSYAGDKINLAKTVSENQIKRAVYIDDYLYMLGDNKLIVLDEKNWEKTGDLDL